RSRYGAARRHPALRCRVQHLPAVREARRDRPRCSRRPRSWWLLRHHPLQHQSRCPPRRRVVEPNPPLPTARYAGGPPEARDILSRLRAEGRVLTKDLLSIADLDAHSLRHLLELGADLKARRGRAPADTRLAGKTLALVF